MTCVLSMGRYGCTQCSPVLGGWLPERLERLVAVCFVQLQEVVADSCEAHGPFGAGVGLESLVDLEGLGWGPEGAQQYIGQGDNAEVPVVPLGLGQADHVKP